MKDVHLMFIGFGNVGQGTLQIIRDEKKFLAERYGIRFSVVAVNDMRLGSLYDANGLPIPDLLDAAAQGDLHTIPASNYDWSVETMLNEAQFDTLVEASFTNLQTGEPALTYIRRALMLNKHVVTTNKGPIALNFHELQTLAREHEVQIGFEGTVMSGTPALAVGMRLLSAAGIQRIQGILNGTTNFILSRMEAGSDYAEALAEAQSLGYAEADPTGDVEGFDAAGKVVILSNLVMGANISLSAVDRKGITHLTTHDIQAAKLEGKRWKLIGAIEHADDKIKASVQPVPLPIAHPLANVSGATNAITYTTRLLGDVTLIGAGAGRLETGYALINDLISIHGNLPN
ncbi:MAG: homoserine dehydrogenase [Chloroflexota bacterium]